MDELHFLQNDDRTSRAQGKLTEGAPNPLERFNGEVRQRSVDGENKWPTLIQNASEKRLRTQAS